MVDKEKVIKGLECCTKYEVGKRLNNCFDCPYVEQIGFNQFRCKSQEMKEDALALLKEQQPLEVVYDINPMTRLPVSFCPKCGEAIQRHEYGRSDMTQLFCSYCGQAVKWD